jgi:predicted nuclease of predicted toxin-antitoxin system
VKLLLDANLSPRLADLLTTAGHNARHLRSLGLQHASDVEVFTLAVNETAVLVTEDTDFGALLAADNAIAPSLILLRSADPLTADQQCALILAELPLAEHELGQGAILVLGRGRARLRPLPLRPED